MPNIKSAKKRVRIIEKKTAQNKAAKSNLKTVIKKADAAIVENGAGRDEAVRLAIKKIDQSVAKGLLHKNNAARKKSQIMKKTNQAG